LLSTRSLGLLDFPWYPLFRGFLALYSGEAISKDNTDMVRRRNVAFSQLKKTIRLAGGTVDANSAAGNYQQWAEGKTKKTIANKPTGALAQKFNVGVIPFEHDYNSTQGAINSHQVAMTQQAQAVLAATTGLTDSLLGITRTLAQTIILFGIYPAVANVKLQAATSTSKLSRTSAITKNSYKTYATRTGGIPYGRSIDAAVVDSTGTAFTDLAKVSEEDVRNAILQKAKGQTFGSYKVVGISFLPEIYPEVELSGVTPPTTVPGLTLPTQ